MTRHIVWEWVAEPGLEYLSLDEGDDLRIDSVVVFPTPGQVSRLHYKVSCTRAWSVRSLDIELHQAGTLRTLSLRRSDADPPVKFRYRGLSSGFTAEIAVDAEGLVEDYPGLWRRLL